jgi:hypothetical protein
LPEQDNGQSGVNDCGKMKEDIYGHVSMKNGLHTLTKLGKLRNIILTNKHADTFKPTTATRQCTAAGPIPQLLNPA